MSKLKIVVINTRKGEATPVLLTVPSRAARFYSPVNCNLQEDSARNTPDLGRMVLQDSILSLSQPDPLPPT